MEKIHINLGSDSYDVHIESGLIDKAGSAIADLTGAEKAAVITEDSIDKLYGMRLVSSLEKAGIKAKMISRAGDGKIPLPSDRQQHLRSAGRLRPWK